MNVDGTGSIIITNSVFTDNIGGLQGGSVTIKYSSTLSGGLLPVVLSNNTFLRNMAYSGGNAIYIGGSSPSCGRGIVMIGNNFTNNIGTKV